MPPDEKIMFDYEYIKRLLEVDSSGKLIISLNKILITQHQDYVKHCIAMSSSERKRTEDYIEFSKSSHKMKSSYGNMGLIELSQLAKTFEKEFLIFADKKNISDIETSHFHSQIHPLLNSFFDCENKSFQILNDVVNKFNQAA